jgi:hypothetical protein
MSNAFASVSDVEELSQGQITATSHPFLQKELDAAARAIQNECGWHIAPVQELSYERTSRLPSVVFLPATQITEVTSVSLNGVDTDLGFVEFDKLTGETNLYARVVEVVFSAGYATVPEDVKALTCELAAGALGVALGVRSASAGGVSVSFARSGGGLTAEDRVRLAAYRIGWIP